MTLQDLLDDYYAPLRGISERTQRLYQMTIKSFGEHLGCEPTTEHLAEMPVARFLAARLRSRSPATAKKDSAQIRALWQFAGSRGIVSSFPVMRPIHVPERVPSAWTTEEMEALLESARLHPGKVSGVPAGLYFAALILTCYETGERISAVLSLRWDDVRGGLVTFRAETRKNQTRDIVRGISPVVIEALEKIKTENPLVFPWDRCKANLWRHMGLILKRAKLPADRKSKFHRLRKTCASYAAAAGLDPQRLLDHASPVTTRAYLDPRIVTTRQACEVLPRVG